MSIVDTKRNDAPLVDFVVEHPATPGSRRVVTAPAPATTSVAAQWAGRRSRVARFFVALGQSGTPGRNAFLTHDRGAYQEYLERAARQR